MRIRLLSDLHLETGPFTWEDQGEDVVVLAGDIGVGIAGIEWAKAIPKPVIYVAVNHEHYGQDIYDNIKAMHACAKGTNVHFLENDEVNLTIDGETLRFLGCTLWTDFGAAHCEKHPVVLRKDHNPQHALMQHALGWMNDYRNITAAKWWTKKNKQRYESILHVTTDNKCFNPLAAFDAHQKSKEWLTDKLKKECEHKTVVVTHHAPSYQSLKQAGMINEKVLNQQYWSPSRRDEIGLYRVAAYASDLEDCLKRKSWKGSGVDLWLHGHLHSRVEYALGGTVVSCNPRGYHQKPLTQKAIEGYALLGYPVSDGSLERSEKTFAENPERGDTLSFERNLLINTDTALEELVLIKSREMLKDLAPLLHDVNAHLHYLKRKDGVIIKLIGEHIARKADQFNGEVKRILVYLHIALKSKCLDNESNYWRAVGLGLTENYVHLKSQKARKSVLNFSVDNNFFLPVPINAEMADLEFSGYTAKPSEWGIKVIKDMQKTIRGFDERLEKCVRELSR
jgi:predicted phosphodiesterase